MGKAKKIIDEHGLPDYRQVIEREWQSVEKLHELASERTIEEGGEIVEKLTALMRNGDIIATLSGLLKGFGGGPAASSGSNNEDEDEGDPTEDEEFENDDNDGKREKPINWQTRFVLDYGLLAKTQLQMQETLKQIQGKNVLFFRCERQTLGNSERVS